MELAINRQLTKEVKAREARERQATQQATQVAKTSILTKAHHTPVVKKSKKDVL